MTKSEKQFGFGGGGQGRFGNLLWHTFRWWHMVPDFRFHRFDHKKPMENGEDIVFLFFTKFIPFYTSTNFVGLIVSDFFNYVLTKNLEMDSSFI
jgi:hypothetical protein